ncbi:MerR family transcriptional regulator [bacterium]|nr:MerR family transcriptional regulator [bacterium]
MVQVNKVFAMTIRELAKTYGVAPSTLRFYERLGLLSPAGRISGKRRYDERGAARLAFVLSARESGFTLTEIKKLISDGSRQIPPRRLWRGVAKAKNLEIERKIARLRAAQQSLQRKATCRCRTLAECETLLARERT